MGRLTKGHPQPLSRPRADAHADSLTAWKTVHSTIAPQEPFKTPSKTMRIVLRRIKAYDDEAAGDKLHAVGQVGEGKGRPCAGQLRTEWPSVDSPRLC